MYPLFPGPEGVAEHRHTSDEEEDQDDAVKDAKLEKKKLQIIFRETLDKLLVAHTKSEVLT